jgi:hypothetical protein
MPRITPMTPADRAVVIDALAFVEQMLILRGGTRGAAEPLRRCQHLIRALQLRMPAMAYPGPDAIREQYFEHLSNSEIDLIRDKLAIAADVYQFHVTAKVSDAAHKLERYLATARGRQREIPQPVYELISRHPIPPPGSASIKNGSLTENSCD